MEPEYENHTQQANSTSWPDYHFTTAETVTEWPDYGYSTEGPDNENHTQQSNTTSWPDYDLTTAEMATDWPDYGYSTEVPDYGYSTEWPDYGDSTTKRPIIEGGEVFGKAERLLAKLVAEVKDVEKEQDRVKTLEKSKQAYNEPFCVCVCVSE